MILLTELCELIIYPVTESFRKLKFQGNRIFINLIFDVYKLSKIKKEKKNNYYRKVDFKKFLSFEIEYTISKYYNKIML